MTMIETTGQSMTVDRLSVPKLAEVFPSQGDWAEADYFALPELHRITELVGGNLEIHDMPTHLHQSILGELYFQLRLFLRVHPLGIVAIAPLPVRLWPSRIREPDLVFMAAAHADRIDNDAWGVPDLVVEVHSPSTLKLDQETKRAEYARAGIAEYWMVDTDANAITVLALGTVEGEAAYVEHGRFGIGDRLSSPLLPGLALDLAAVFGEA